MSDKKDIPPCLYEWSGQLSAHGQYQLKIFTRGPISAREIRNLIAQLSLAATWVDEDTNAAQGIAAGTAETSAAQAPCEAQEPDPKGCAMTSPSPMKSPDRDAADETTA